MRLLPTIAAATNALSSDGHSSVGGCVTLPPVLADAEVAAAPAGLAPGAVLLMAGPKDGVVAGRVALPPVLGDEGFTAPAVLAAVVRPIVGPRDGTAASALDVVVPIVGALEDKGVVDAPLSPLLVAVEGEAALPLPVAAEPVPTVELVEVAPVVTVVELELVELGPMVTGKAVVCAAAGTATVARARAKPKALSMTARPNERSLAKRPDPGAVPIRRTAGWAQGARWRTARAASVKINAPCEGVEQPAAQALALVLVRRPFDL